MTRKIAVLVALGVAFPVELVNFVVFMPPLDVGIPDDAPWYAKLLGLQWALLHYPGLRLTSLLDPFYKAYPLDVLTWFLSGYIETALIIIACILVFHWFRRWMDRRLEEAA